jgi:hypothetical protein
VAILSAEDILSADDRKFDVVPCPEWGGDVRIASITGTQRDAYEASIIQTNGNDRKVNMHNARVKLIVLCAVDEEGRKLFTSENLSALGRKNAAPIDRVFDGCRRLAGMSENDVERLVENFGDAPSDGDTSA